jgi:hypothetical protein
MLQIRGRANQPGELLIVEGIDGYPVQFQFMVTAGRFLYCAQTESQAAFNLTQAEFGL